MLESSNSSLVIGVQYSGWGAGIDNQVFVATPSSLKILSFEVFFIFILFILSFVKLTFGQLLLFRK